MVVEDVVGDIAACVVEASTGSFVVDCRTSETDVVLGLAEVEETGTEVVGGAVSEVDGDKVGWAVVDIVKGEVVGERVVELTCGALVRVAVVELATGVVETGNAVVGGDVELVAGMVSRSMVVVSPSPTGSLHVPQVPAH
mmetsp:Transcript_56330/g.119893  ORF Transcript_56330/g.119893 Transcript_56330/m.119893 type:complete len:140 (-) Transcript_56330:1772-2191(-)